MAKNCFENKRKELFLIVSLIILCLDLTFVVINNLSAKKALYASLTQQLKGHQQSFKIGTEMTYSTMLQIASFISQNQSYNQLFLQGKKAVTLEGGGKGGEKARQARQALLAKVEAGWKEMTQKFGIRQLHYHLGAGSLSFLRVHKPSKFGDRMDKIRHTIVDTNKEKTPRTGFETGRVYSGLRGVAPVWTIDPETQQKTYVGALEAGTSFENVLKILDDSLNIGVTILLSQKHVEKNMWKKEVMKNFGETKSDCRCFIEQSSRENSEQVLRKITFTDDFQSEEVQIITLNHRRHAVFYFPLRDYFGTKHPEAPSVGFVMIWADVTEAEVAFRENSFINIMLAAFSFCVIELVLLGALKIESRFRKVEQMATVDALTGLANRGHFDVQLAKEINRCRRHEHPISLIMCDIDYFKQFNDTYGHVAGDDCLEAVAQALQAEMKRSSDYVARYGGEEFVIILPNTALQDAVVIAERVRVAISDLKIPHSSSKISQSLTMSLGIVTSFLNNEEIEPEKLIKIADHFLYQAKEQGRNRVGYDETDV